MLYKVIAFFAAFSLLPLCASCVAESKPTVPSILVITADDLGNQLGSYGDVTVPTPNIDALAARGTRFTRAYVTQPSCSPSRSSFLSGLYPHQNGQLGLAHMGFSMTRDWPVAPGLLREQLGYFTALAGKLHVGPSTAFDFFDLKEHEAGTLWTREVNAVGEKAARYFKEADGWPFYAQFDLFDPHPPFEAQVEGLPEKPIAVDQVKTFSWISGAAPVLQTDTANYYNSVSRLDSIVGRIVEELRKAGRLENTVIVFWSDNGPAFPRAKTTLYEAGTRIPFIMAGPGVKAGQVRNELVSMVDVMPTLLQIAGAKLPLADVVYTGRDLSPLLRGEQVAWRRYLFTEENFHTPQMWAPARAVTDGKWKLIESLPVGKSKIKIELYNLEQDPDERTNLANRAPRKAQRDDLYTALQQWRAETADPLLDAEIYIRLEKIYMAADEPVAPWYQPRGQ